MKGKAEGKCVSSRQISFPIATEDFQACYFHYTSFSGKKGYSNSRTIGTQKFKEILLYSCSNTCKEVKNDE